MENLRGALLMTGAMAAFAVEDAIIKGTSTLMPTGQILCFIGLFGTLIFWLILRLRGLPLFTRALISPAVMVRNIGEVFGTLGYVLGFTLGDLSTAAAILQAGPLMVVLGAALFLGETVGWRRWTAVSVGFVGVMIVLRPGTGSFDPVSLWAVVGVAGLSMRDLATRRIKGDVPSLQISASAFAFVVPTGLIMLAMAGDTPVAVGGGAMLGIAGALAFGMSGYMAIVGATRIGELSVIAAFRYSRIVFALILGVVFFAEHPDPATYIGAALIVGSGLYAFWRERRAKARAASLPPQPTL
ncbi:DMT family transporter [Pelagovum pacificum]|uniref:DMT family transporter n=1 Tax=Pelagovum pacificum TaxID=2588711 RepID=A0A5C5GDK0_9RHOB|nr:DMT family transporter [Pelagovum pacificum]QQA44854.1 DMT family transporter [Pelagovum pacificum]TNY32041.1 DMT family transporter [Pelagovum pacificum]